MRPYAKPQVITRERCLVEGCERWEELANGRPAGGLCAAHRKRKQQGRQLETPIRQFFSRGSFRSLLVDAAVTLAEVDPADDAAFDRALARVVRRIERYRKRRQRTQAQVPSTR